MQVVDDLYEHHLHSAYLCNVGICGALDLTGDSTGIKKLHKVPKARGGSPEAIFLVHQRVYRCIHDPFSVQDLPIVPGPRAACPLTCPEMGMKATGLNITCAFRGLSWLVAERLETCSGHSDRAFHWIPAKRRRKEAHGAWIPRTNLWAARTASSLHLNITPFR